MPIKIVALTSVNSDNLEDVSTYLATTAPLLEEAGAQIVGTYDINSTVVGQASPAVMTIVDYPDEEAISLVFDSAEYGLLREVRERAFLHYEIYRLNGNGDSSALPAQLTPA